MDSNSNIRELPGVGPKRAAAYKSAGVAVIRDLLLYFPRDYLNLNRLYTISECLSDSMDNENVAIQAMITKKTPAVRIRNKLNITKASIEDGTGKAELTAFNIPTFFNRYEISRDYVFYGKAKIFDNKLSMSNPRIFEADTDLGYVPVYPAISGISQERLIENVREALKLTVSHFTDLIPETIRALSGLCDIATALRLIHFPQSEADIETAKNRLAFDELYEMRMSLALTKRERESIPGLVFDKKPLALEQFYNILPFELTNSQKTAVSEIIADCTSGGAMNRMLCGDVGSGKTAVAAAACVLARANGYQSALMAPTEILARQHYNTLEKLLSPSGIKVVCLLGAQTAKEQHLIREQIAEGAADVAVGTHALISDRAAFSKLGLVIADEQHRFGVRQREKLAEKGDNPHRLIMSATPIPRTMAMMLYGDLDISYLTDMPNGRLPIETFAVTDKLRERAYHFLKEQLDKGHQGYIVCPRIEDNDDDYSSAVSYAENLRTGSFAGYSVGLLHGKLSADETAAVMNDFLSGSIQLLVTTTVIEVGVDVANATVILIENAELFGLSQLHQLRGRVGRGNAQSYCILMTGNATPEVRERLKMLSSTASGIDIARYDLEHRGAGDFLGVKQSGFAHFRFADRFTLEFMEQVDNAVKDALGEREAVTRPPLPQTPSPRD